MAYMSQEQKKKIAPVVKAICAKYGVKASLRVEHYSVLHLNIHSGKLDFFGDRNPDKWPESSMAQRAGSIQVNPYWYHEQFQGKSLAFLREVVPALNEGNHDNSQPEFDHFDVGWYVSVNVGQWNKPYVLIH